MKGRLPLSIVAVALALGIQGFSGCAKDEEPAGPDPDAGIYEGTWVLRHVTTAPGSEPCLEEEVGALVSEGPFTVDGSGRFSLPAEAGRPPVTGTVTSDGVVNVILPADPAGMGSCPAGSASGTCSSADLCSGSYTQAGNQGVWTMVRATTASPYAGTWTLTHERTSADPGACADGDTIGHAGTDGPFAIDATGYFLLPGDEDASELPVAGVVSAAGVVNIYLPVDLPGEGDCPAGMGSGTCATADSCSGVYSKGGNHGVWTMVRTP